MKADFLCVTSPNASHRLVLLHGWGADAEDLMPLGEELISQMQRKIELLSFRAPDEHPLGQGRQWYELFPAKWDSVPNSVKKLRSRLTALSNSQIPLQRTVVFGFSQGGAMAIASGCDLPIAGIIGCSAYPHPNWIPPENSPSVLLTHGKNDEIVPFSGSEKLFKSLKLKNTEVELIPFEGAHEIPLKVIPSLQKTLNRWFSN